MQVVSTSPFLVTGAAGFVGSHIVKQLLQQNYRVRAAVRSLANKDRYSCLSDLVPEKANNLEFVEADLANKASWPPAVEGCQGIFHVATPMDFTMGEEEMIKTSVSGVMNILEAALQKGVAKFIYTSTAMVLGDGKHYDKITFTEDDWIGDAAVGGYAVSKVKAQEAAEEFCKQHQDKITLVSVLPPLVIGPVVSNYAPSSQMFVGSMLEGSFPRVTGGKIAAVDVRDLAEMQIRLMNNDVPNGRRYICSVDLISVEEVMDILDKEFSKLGYNIPKASVSKEEAKSTPNFIAQIMLVGEIAYSNQRSIKELKIKYRTVAETILDTGKSLIEKGLVSKKT